MIKIYTELEKLAKDIGEQELKSRYKVDNEALFNMHTLKEPITKEDEEAMLNIDKASVIDESRVNKYSKDLLIKTPYGVTTITNLSTGCKTVINFLHLKDDNIILDVTECGWNALEELFKHYEKRRSDVILVLRHMDEISNCLDREYQINNEKVVSNLLDI